MKRPKSFYPHLLKYIVLFLILPYVLLLGYIFVNMISTNNQAINEKITLFENQNAHTRDSLLNDIVNRARNLSNNNLLTSFFISDYSVKSWYNYQTDVLETATLGHDSISDFTTKFFYTNETIPQGFGTFFDIEVALSFSFFEEFVNSDLSYAWIKPQQASEYPQDPYNLFHYNYTYLHKVFVNDELSHIIAISSPANVVNQSLFLDTSQDVAYLYSSADTVIIGPKQFADSIASMEEYTIDSLNQANYRVGTFNFSGLDQTIFYLWEPDNTYLGTIIIMTLVVLLSFFAVWKVLSIVRRLYNDVALCVDEFDMIVQEQSYANTISGVSHKLKSRPSFLEINKIKSIFNALIKNINNLILITAKQSSDITDSQLKAMQHQINPHFMYNTLEVFAYRMIQHDMTDCAEAIVSFADILRYNISENNVISSVKEELEQVKRYFQIQKIKFDKADLNIEIEDNCINLIIMRFLLQPLVENCFAHAIKDGKININIAVKKEENFICFEVIDDGVGIDEDKLEKLNEIASARDTEFDGHIGLKNISKRLSLFYNNNYDFSISSEKNVFTKITLKLGILDNSNS